MIETPEQLAAALQTWLALSVKANEIRLQMERIQKLVVLSVDDGQELQDLYWPVVFGKTALYLRDGKLGIGGATVLQQLPSADLPTDVDNWIKALELTAFPKRDDNLPF